jgi:predicted alpha-1,6-mannanase (GH76 family)
MKRNNIILNFSPYPGRLLIMAALGLSTMLASCKKEQANIQPADAATSALKVPAVDLGQSFATLPTKSEALVAMQVYDNSFYNQYGTYGPSFKAYYWKDEGHTGRMDFWTQQEAIEMLIDAYDINPSTDLKNKILYLYNGVRDGYGTLWTSNTFNDDVVWGALMCVRAWKITNDGGQLDMAKSNFDMMWNRAWNTSVNGGGLFWTTANNTKNTCVNAPAAICALLLYQATGDTGYRDKAKLIMDWMISKLYIASTGEVKGAIDNSGVITQGPLSYTQGTFIGACDLMRAPYPSGGYLATGQKALDFARSNLCITSGGILLDENGNADTQGMKSIFARWACRFVKNTGTVSNYGAWLNNNAGQAWSIRNSRGLMWNIWGTRTAESNRNAFETTGGVAMMNGVYQYQ